MPEMTVDADLIREMLREQHPDLAGLRLRPVARGWDNELWRLGEDLVVRIPVTEQAPDLLRKEYRWLPGLAEGLPLPVPVPLRLGEPTRRFPRHWTIARWVPGEPADRAPVSRGDDAARQLAAFLRALHAPAPAGAPVNPSRNVPLARMSRIVADLTGRLAPAGIACDIGKIWEAAIAAPPWSRAPVWIHADLHPANVVTADGSLAGVIDFGDMCAGDPATDLAAAWYLLPAGTAGAFFAAYGAADEATVLRAKGWAIRIGLMLLDIGRAGDLGLPGGKPTWGPAGRLTLERVVADSFQ